MGKKGMWSIAKSAALYRLRQWSSGYFHIHSDGNLHALKGCDLHKIVRDLARKGIEAPLLLRFDGIIEDRMHRLCRSFATAIERSHYKNIYQPVFPIKVNPEQYVMEGICKAGAPYKMGLEVGSKAELMVALGVEVAKGSLVLCNGYKDAEYMELALLSTHMGRRPIIIVEQLYELTLVLDVAERLGVEAEIGLRTKPYRKAPGKWASSGGEQGKFGLRVSEIMKAVHLLQDRKKEHWVKLLHFHSGSQIASKHALKKALQESARLYVHLAKICPALSFFDIGGGLAVDYEGSKSSSEGSMDYSIEEYGSTVVSIIGKMCDKVQLAHPLLISESGRALVAHHELLIINALDESSAADHFTHQEPLWKKSSILRRMTQLYEQIIPENCQEILNKADSLRESIVEKFVSGCVTLAKRTQVDQIYHQVITKIHSLTYDQEGASEVVKSLNSKLRHVCSCNFSIFQSLPDMWAIQQVFPIMPIHRLKEQPVRKSMIVDVTCDSDGKLEQFVGAAGLQNFFLMHEPNQEPYYIGVFLIGAYQEILGNYHNLFGKMHVINVREEGDQVILDEVLGDTIGDMLHYMHYDKATLLKRVEGSLQGSKLNPKEIEGLKKRYKKALSSSTYLKNT